ncbi:hypothetical protein Tco_0877043 [Tanacetum coccineum]|uniref:Uncharacterized protein n=1 Tax=Tanacetum coccineum TaxID=301880 RepID=A0ABQ5BWM8_9ASTR
MKAPSDSNFRALSNGMLGEFYRLHLDLEKRSQYVEIEEIDEFLQDLEGRYDMVLQCLGKSDEFILNHEGDKNDAGLISLKSDLTIKVYNETRDNWLIDFIETGTDI